MFSHLRASEMKLLARRESYAFVIAEIGVSLMDCYDLNLLVPITILSIRSPASVPTPSQLPFASLIARSAYSTAILIEFQNKSEAICLAKAALLSN